MAEGGDTVVVGDGEAVLRCEVVVHGHNNGAELAVERVVGAGGHGEEHGATTVEVDDHGVRCLGRRGEGVACLEAIVVAQEGEVGAGQAVVLALSGETEAEAWAGEHVVGEVVVAAWEGEVGAGEVVALASSGEVEADAWVESTRQGMLW